MNDAKSSERDDDVTDGYSSPPCSLHELDVSYLGYLAADEVLALLNELIEAERAGAKVVGRLGETATDDNVATTLRAVAKDEARFCAMLRRHVARLGGTPSRKTGLFHDKVMALEGIGPRIELLNRGQGWVARKLREALPRIHDDALRRDLQEMLTVHERNIQRCGELPTPG
jgi:hypothetical protein